MNPNSMKSFLFVSLIATSFLGSYCIPVVSKRKQVESWITVGSGRRISDSVYHQGILIVRQHDGPGYIVPMFSTNDKNNKNFPIPFILVFDFDNSMCLLTDFDVLPAGNNPMAFTTGGRFAMHGCEGEFSLELESDGHKLIESIEWKESTQAAYQKLEAKQGRVFRIGLSEDSKRFVLRQMDLPLLDEKLIERIVGMDGKSEETRKRLNDWWRKGLKQPKNLEEKMRENGENPR